MKNRTTNATGALFALITLVSFAAPASFAAQKNKPTPTPVPSPSNPTPSTSHIPTARDSATVERELMELQLLRMRRDEADRERSRQVADLTREFEALEQINTSILVPLSTAGAYDHKGVAKIAAHVKARASKIKYNAPFVLKDKTGQKIKFDESAKLGSLLPELSRLVKSFLDNPVFHVASPNDKELRSTAGHDLDSIIKLSDTIEKIAKKLSKSAASS
jgi:hypothetical protein